MRYKILCQTISVDKEVYKINTSLINTKNRWESFMMPDRKVEQEQTDEFCV